MQHLKQPIARRANEEDGCKGHFFEQRFYSGALLSEEAVLAAMAYVDLNPVRAKLAKRLAQCQHASISARLLENSRAVLADFLRPLASGLARGGGQKAAAAGRAPRLGVTLAAYVARLEAVVEAEAASDREARWIAGWRPWPSTSAPTARRPGWSSGRSTAACGFAKCPCLPDLRALPTGGDNDRLPA